MKIVHLADYYNNNTGHPLQKMTDKLAEKGIETEVWCSSKEIYSVPSQDSKAKARIVRFGYFDFFRKPIFLGIIPKLAERKFDIIHAHVLGFYCTTITALLKPIFNYKLIIQADFDAEHPKNAFWKKPYFWLTKKLPCKLADRVLVFTKKQKQEICKECSIAESKIEIVPIGTDIKAFKNAGTANLRKKLKLGKKLILLNVSTIYPVKRLELIIEAVKLDKRFVLVHAGGVQDKEYFESLEKIVEKEKLQERIFFLGAIKNSELPKYYKDSDVYVQSSKRESYCIPLVEALAAGKPIISTRVGIAEEIIDKNNGFFVTDGQGIAKVLQTLAGKKRRMQILGKESLKKARKFSWERIVERLIGIYEGLK